MARAVMQVYSGNVAKKEHLRFVKSRGWGRLVSPVHWRAPQDDLPWVFDNGAFSAYIQGKPFPLDKFVLHLARLIHHKPPDFGVVPDIVGGGFESLTFSISHLDTMWWGVPSYLAVQDGMTLQDVEPVLHLFQGIFVGGTCKTNTRGNRLDLEPAKARSSGWKWDSAQAWVQLAHKHGKKCHIGRVGAFHDIVEARRIGADSIDSTSWATNDKHWVPDAALKVEVEPVEDGDYGAYADVRVCGDLIDDEGDGLGICRLAPSHAGGHDWQAYYGMAGAPPIFANDRGPHLWVEELGLERQLRGLVDKDLEVDEWTG